MEEQYGTNNVCAAEDPGKYSELYFARYIQSLQAVIKEHLPPNIFDSDSLQSFVDACKATQASIKAKEKAVEILRALQKEYANDADIQKAQQTVDACEDVVESCHTLFASIGHVVLKDLDIIKYLGETVLLQCTVLIQSTPKGLADWVQLDRERHGKLIDQFLADPDWMKQMILNGGASKGHYGHAILIHSNLLLQIADTSTKIRHKLALAIALEHATPIPVFKEEDTCIDPIARFWHYVHAFEKGELDKNFETLSVWELRFVVDSNAHNEDLQWGRDYLKAYRPDQVLMADDQWRYVMTVRTDCNYQQPEHPYSNYKELISAGGKCGPRAFMGRFICKAFGLPTWGVRQPGHAGLSRWTPSGWVICLGAAFQWSSWEDERYTGNNKTRLRHGPDFVQETQARRYKCPNHFYKSMSLLECLAECFGETVVEEVDPNKIWRSLSLAQRRLLAQPSEHCPWQDGNLQQRAAGSFSNTESDPCIQKEKSIQLDSSGNIVIPASAFTKSSKPDKSVFVLPSFLGGDQLHLRENGCVEYELPSVIPKGKFFLTCRFVNIHRRQVPLLLTVENHGEDNVVAIYHVEIEYTEGKWKTTIPIEIEVLPGGLLKFERESGCHGLSIKEFMLTP